MNEQQEFEAWWDQDCDTRKNPYSQHSMMYWAWEAWKAGRKAEREACAVICENYRDYFNSDENYHSTLIRARGQHD